MSLRSSAFPAKLGAARAARVLARRLGRGGTTVAGRLLLRLEPDAIDRLGARLGEGSVLVSATNGKTTTASLLAGILQRAGRTLVHNRAGSNMHWGVATALLEAGSAPEQLGLFEVDEAWLPEVARRLRPRAFLLANLFRDQLDRYGELEIVAERWADMVAGSPPETTLVLNADDPLIADLGRERDERAVLHFGIDDDSLALPALQHASDSKGCRRCGHAYAYAAAYLAHLGRYECPNCGRRRPDLGVSARAVTLRGMDGSDIVMDTPAGEVAVRFPLPGVYNVYNALAAAACAVALGASAEEIGAGLEAVTAAFGRTERLRLGARDLAILLIKNPAGANEVLRTLTLEEGDLDLWIALNDHTADGHDVSWIWDADFELLAGRARRITCSGTRAEEMALRLKYAGVDAELEVERHLERSLDQASASGDGAPLYALPTYTALLELRRILTARGAAPRWSE